jgi:hypothetical protein
VTFVDTSSVLNDHALCSKDPWIHDVTIKCAPSQVPAGVALDQAAAFCGHPIENATAHGQRVIADKVREAIAAPPSTPTPSTTGGSSSSQPVAVSPALVNCTANCQITGQIVFTHPTWGRATLVTTRSGGTGCGSVAMYVVDTHPDVKYSKNVGSGCFETLAPVLPTPDRAGHLLINYNPGRYNGVIVLASTPGGFTDFGSIPPDNSYGGRFYYANAVDLDGNGTFAIRAMSNDCTPSCAGGAITTKIYRWNDTDYAESP